MKKKLNQLAACGLLSALALTGCSSGGDSGGTPLANPAAVLNYIFATDHEGYVTVAAHNEDNTVTDLGSFQPLNSTGGALSLGEIHVAHGKAFVVISEGLTDAGGNFTGGGLGIADLATMHLENIQPMPTTLTFAEDGVSATTSRFVHTYMDPDGHHLWMNNDGVTATGLDSVFRINIDPEDAEYLHYEEIVVGNGHKKSAFAYPTDPGAPALKLFATHNLTEESISVIDNDPMSATFLEVLTTVNLNNGTAGQNTVHGMGFSTVSGHLYTGVTKGLDIGLSIIDATSAALTHSTIDAGMDMGMNQIPAAGYVKVSHDGRWVMTVGYVNEIGYLSIVDAQTDTVTDVINLGNLSASSFNISEMEMDMGGGMTMDHVKIFVPSRQTTASTTEITTQIAVIDFDPMTGTGSDPRYVDVEAGPDHRNGKVSHDSMFAYYPNGGDCGASHDQHGPGCTLISIIDAMSEQVVAEMHTAGHEPGNLLVVPASEITGVDPGAGGGGGDHTH
jgi:hypothetical protein